MKLSIFLMFVLGFSSLFSSHAFAENFQCEVKVNATTLISKKVTSLRGQKIPIGETQQIRAFLTENQIHLFTLEAFLPSVEARVYSQATMRAVGDVINLSYWDRDVLYELQCNAI